MKTSLNMKLKQSSYAVMTALAVLATPQFARAGAGWADNIDKAGAPFKQPTFYANSPMGQQAAHGQNDLPGTLRDTGTALRKFVDNLPLIDGYVNNSALLNANSVGATGRHIPMAIKEALPAGAAGHSVSYPDADYYEIAVVEYREQLHSDLPPVVKTAATVAGQGPVVTGGTTLRGYVQIWTPNLPGSISKTQLFYLNGKPVLDNTGKVVYMVGDQPHYLGPVIDSQKGTPVRIRFDNYLPTGHYDPITKTRGGDLFLPTDTTISGSGLGPNGAVDATAPNAYDMYTQNRTNIYLQGADNPWISDGNPNAWITPAGENTQYPVGVATQNVPDMPNPGPGSQTFYYPNNESAKMVWYHDYTTGSTRMNVYAGVMSAFMIHDAAEAALKAPGGALNGMDEIPLVFEDKTFVPKDIATEDAKWSTDAWGQYGDLWFPHVYETNQNPDAIDGLNPPGRWDYGPWFWPIFPAPLAMPTGEYGHASVTLESIHDTPVINGVAYPNLTAEPKAYRFRLLNASNSRFLNLGFYVAAPIAVAVGNGGMNYAQPAVPATSTSAAIPGSVVSISPDDNGLVPTASLVVAPIAPPTVSVVAGGAGYSASTTVSFSGGGAITQATGHVVLGTNGAISAVVVDTAGSGYNVAAAGPIVISFIDPAGTGTGALATATAAIGGQVVSVTLNPPPAGQSYVYNVNTPVASVQDQTGAGSGAKLVASANTEVAMVPAAAPAGNQPYDISTYDGRPGGIPDPSAVGPNIIHIGTEAGLLAQVNVIPSTPVTYDPLRRIVTVYNVLVHGLYVGPGENADFVVDFSQFAGQTLIVYNDAPAPDPLLDPRYDYFTGDGDQTNTGGADTTLPGYGPNTRTIMRVNVASKQFNGAAPAAPYDPLGTGGPLATGLPAAFAAGQEQPLIPAAWQNQAYGVTLNDNLAHIYAGSYQQPTYSYSLGGAQTLTGFRLDSAGGGYTVPPTVSLVGGLGPNGVAATAHAVLDNAGARVDSIVLDTPGSGYTSQPSVVLAGGDGIGASATAITSTTQETNVFGKGIQELFDPYYGRMNATFSAELPFVNGLIATTIPVGSIDPPTEQIADGEMQVWKITHNGVATHQVHLHQFDVQIINRVAWDGTIKALDPAEFGWKQTIKMNPLEDVYLAVRPKAVLVPFGVPQAIHALDPTQALGATMGFSQVNPLTGIATTVTNQLYDFDWEYVWNNYLLGNDAIDFRRPMIVNYGTTAPAPVPGVSYNPAKQTVSWTDPTPAAVSLGDKSNEQGFLIQRTDTDTFPPLPDSPPQSAAQAGLNPAGYLPNVVAANVTTWVDPVPAASTTRYRVLAFNAAGFSPSYTATVPGTGATGTASTAIGGNGGSNGFAPGVPAAPVGVHGRIGAYVPATGAFPITITWSAIAPPRNGFQILRQGGIDVAGGPIADVTFVVPAGTRPVNGVYSFVDNSATELSGYTYTVFADNSNNGRPLLGAGTFTQVYTKFGTPPPVNGMTAMGADNGNAVVLSWTAPTAITPDPNVAASNHITGYRVVRTTNGAVTQVAQVHEAQNAVSGTITPPDTSWKDTAPIQGAASTYTVYGVNGNLIGTATGATSSVSYTPGTVAAPGLAGLTTYVNSPTQVTLNWAPAPTGSTVTGYIVTRTSGASTVTLTTGNTPAISYVDSSAKQNTSYTYTVQWLNGGNGGLAMTTAPVITPYAPATAVVNLTGAANGTASQITLNWTTGGAATAYLVSRCTNAGTGTSCSGPYTLMATGITATSYIDQAVTAGVSYSYQVIAQNGPVNVSASVTVPVFDLPIPLAPTTISNTIALGSITVTWNASATATSTGYVVQRSADNGVTFANLATVSGRTTLSYVDTTPVLGSTYQYRVIAQEVYAGYPTLSSVTPSPVTTAVYAVQSAPVFTGTLPVYGGTATAPTVSFSFTETALAGAPPVTGFQVFRNGVLISPVTTSNGFTDTPPPGAPYAYTVSASNLLGNSAVSSAVTADVVTQPAPTAVNTVFVSPTTSTVRWTASVADPLAPAISAYQVWGTTTTAAGVVSAPALLGTTATGSTTSLAVSESVGNSYVYTVRSVNLIGSSADSLPSASFADVVPSAPGTPTASFASGTSVNLAWAAATVVANAPPITGYNVYNNGVLVNPTPLAATATSYTASTVVGASYSFTVAAINAVGVSTPSAAVVYSDTVPTAPTTLAASPLSPTSLGLSWTASSVATGAPAISGYNVYNNGVLVNTTPLAATATSYTATTVVGSAYNFTVTAINAVGKSLASNTVLFADNVPTAPGTLAVSPLSPTSAGLNWTAASVAANAPAISGYNVYNNGVLVNTTPLAATATSYTATTVLGSSYSFTVAAINAVGVSTPSAAVVYSDTVPTAPTTLAASPLSPTSLGLSWKASSVATGAPAISGYNVYNNGVLVNTTPLAATATSYTATTVIGSSYSFTVVAINAVGVSTPSNTVVYSDSAPTAPATLAASPLSPTSLGLSWKASSVATGAPAITGYNVYNNGVLVTTTPLAATATSYTATTVVGSTYSFTVAAINAVGVSTASNAVLYSDTVPTAPASLSAGLLSPTSVGLSWTAATVAANAPAITGYNVYNNGVLVNTTPLAATAVSYTATTAVGSAYGYTVVALNAAGPSAASNTVLYSDSVPTAPATLAASPLSPTSLGLSWKASSVATGAPAITGYNVYNNGVLVTTTPLAATATSYTATTAVGSSYSFTVAAINAVGVSTASNAVPFADSVPTAPAGLALSPLSATSVGLSWTGASVAANAPAISGYNVYNNGVLVNAAPLAATTTSYTATVTSGGSYAFSVKAVNAAGPSAASNTVAFLDSVPNAPTAASAVFVSPTSATVKWTAATLAAGAPAITGYRVYNNGVLLTAAPLAANATSYAATTAAGTSYAFTVVAVNAVGASAASNTVVYSDTVPTAPSRLTLAVTSATSATLSWTASTVAAGAQAISGYQVYNGATLLTPTPLAATATTYTASLAVGTSYSFTVVAVNAVGKSTASNTALFADTVPTSVVTPAFVSSARNLPLVINNTDTVTISWTPSVNAANAPAITSYVVEYASNAAFTIGLVSQTVTVAAGQTLSGRQLATFTKVTRGPSPVGAATATSYFRVQAVNLSGTSNGAVLVVAPALLR